MVIAGVIAEYNPFHCGHAYHLHETKKSGADAVVAVMSGHYVQRGTPAILSKFARAEAAVCCGVDLVLELPVPWAIGRAQTFAEGAVSVLHHLGCVNKLSFGSECGDVSRILKAASALQNDETAKLTNQILSAGNITFAAARQQAVCSQFGEETANVLDNPNDTLACEYVMAANRMQFSADYMAVQRIGSHDKSDAEGFASASQIRDVLMSGGALYGCPAAMQTVWDGQVHAGAAPASLQYMERAILADWRTADPQALSELPDVSEGLENRMQDAARKADTLADFYDLAKTKRYTHARIRRIVLARFLRIYARDIPKNIPYIRVLAVGEKGKEILHLAKKTCDVPILTRNADVRNADADALNLLRIEERAGELYAMLQPAIGKSAMDLQTPIFIL